MLQLLLGGSGSGKTTLLYQRIRARAEKGEKSILLVPEQFTSSTEGRIHREMGDALSGLVESFSFTSLAEHILSAEGGSAVQTLSDAGRAVLVRRALEELQDNVHYYYRHRRSAAFCQMAAETIDELKSAGLSGRQLYELAQDCGTDSAKLSELALIFQGYETLLAGTGMDPSDRLELAASRLEAALARGELPEFLRDRAVFIDEFDTFNAPKKRLMGALLASLPTVTVALCDDGTPLVPGDVSLFSGAKQVAAQLRQLARRNGTEVAVPELLRRDVRHADAPGIAAAAQLLATGRCDPPPACPEIKLFAAPSREEEARAAAAAIRRLMRQGVRCGKVAVVCRDISKYRAAVKYEFRMADIPLYCDEPTTPEFSAPATAVRCLLAIARGAELTEQLTTLAKTGLCALTEEEVCALENYAYTWSPNAAAWRAPFEKNPRGFGDVEPTDEDRENLARAEKGPRPSHHRRRRPAREAPLRQRRADEPRPLLLPEGAGRGGRSGRAGGGHPGRAGHPRRRGSRPGVERGHGPAGRDGKSAGRPERHHPRVRRAVRAAAALVGPRPHPPDAGRRGAGQRRQDAP